MPGECLGQLSHRGTVRRGLAERGEHRVLEFLGNGLAHDPQAGHLLQRVPGQQGGRASSLKRGIAREHLVEDAAQAVDVAPPVELGLPGRLLRAHVLRGTDHDTRMRQLRPGGCLQGARDAEVGDQRVTVEQQDVLGLDVAVDDAVPVRVGQRFRRLPGDSDRLRQGESMLPLEPLAKGLALDIGHHVVEEALRLARVVQGQDVGVLEVGGDLHFVDEALYADRGGQVPPEDLDATWRPCRRSRARYTSAIPPSPSLRSIS